MMNTNQHCAHKGLSLPGKAVSIRILISTFALITLFAGALLLFIPDL